MERHSCGMLVKEKTENSSSSAAGDKKTFAKEGYVQKPEKRNAQHQVSSAFAKRKRYKPPRRCVPKKPQPPPKVIVPKKPVAVFVQVTNLKRRDAFVSQGAECVMLSKAFYVKHANELVKKRMRYNIRPFPDEETFQENLQIKEDWILYKKCLLEDLTSRL
ncbi:hypothetical protein ACJMK2_032837 [Sinanodonta woodiana]|uniref:Uncharacterized protein n=1 Tax=Sinanodonta woodiana TaxID=1069815 RepID=A0ABD3X377_SINWO